MPACVSKPKENMEIDNVAKKNGIIGDAFIVTECTANGKTTNHKGEIQTIVNKSTS